MKSARQKQITTLISERDIDTQEELMQLLAVAGFKATQATISRDIKELRLVKIATPDGLYKYAPPGSTDVRPNAKYENILRETVTGAKCSGNIVVVRTYSGMAMAACAAIDAMEWNEVVGSLAGDDTIFIVASSPEGARVVAGLFGE
ncbi:MAG: hypothetical protein FWB93_03475 [Oscillospiraceae bacterium]|nr:hypothetical protein [Oscillospiraceae bacterium]